MGEEVDWEKKYRTLMRHVQMALGKLDDPIQHLPKAAVDAMAYLHEGMRCAAEVAPKGPDESS